MREFGLIGYPLGHSFSKGFFAAKFKAEEIDACYENFPLEDIGQFPSLLASHPQLEGINVTIPHKEKIIGYLHHQTPVVSAIGACNCIRIHNNELTGHNTDVIGFKKSLLKKLDTHHESALVFGTGGSSKAVQYILKELQISFLVISRRSEPARGIVAYDDLTQDQLHNATLWINTTPLGMTPNIQGMPPLDYDMITKRHYLYDLVYNPAETRFLAMGRARGAVTENGQDMLVIQAEESWAIWNS